MNTVLVKIWAYLPCDLGITIIVKSFEKTHFVLIHPSNSHKTAASACLVALELRTGKKSMELGVIRENIMNPQPLRKILTGNPVVTLQVQSNTSHNLVIRSAAYNSINQ